MRRRIKYILAGAQLHNLSRIHNCDTVCHIGNHPKIMGNKDNGQIPLCLQIIDQLQNLSLNGHIQCRGRLVADQNIRICRQRNGNNNSLTHAAGKFKGILIITFPGVGYTYFLHQLQSLVFCHSLCDLHNHAGRIFLKEGYQFFSFLVIVPLSAMLQQLAVMLYQTIQACKNGAFCGLQIHCRRRNDLPGRLFSPGCHSVIFSLLPFMYFSCFLIFSNAFKISMQVAFQTDSKSISYAVLADLQPINGAFHCNSQFFRSFHTQLLVQ